MKIERVQYDGDGQWLDVHFDDGDSFRLPTPWLRAVLRLPFARGFLATHGTPKPLNEETSLEPVERRDEPRKPGETRRSYFKKETKP